MDVKNDLFDGCLGGQDRPAKPNSKQNQEDGCNNLCHGLGLLFRLGFKQLCVLPIAVLFQIVLGDEAQ